ncbi:cellulase [Mucilaginibacter terrenus]|uniref:Endoglucanase n=1 Tax=Mucilaginibacter terrenus TaxID=2482727 RepID=A0A3E2NUI2_9SPHI|nr:glycoside hydrolase family 9 protein [Mucilaginibacter terrenus]RFZ84658.1 cellulase [Mucilaginibacter terrenus]
MAYHSKRFFSACLLILLASLKLDAQDTSSGASTIRLNQIGFYPGAPKTAIVTTGTTGDFQIRKAGKVVYTGKLKQSLKPGFSGQYTSIADFSNFTTPGTYTLTVKGVGQSYPFNISNSANSGVATGTLKAFYFMRASAPLEKKYAGKWQRASGHPDNKVLVHPSAADAKRPAGTVISSPGGWYDAGDYNKYVVNSGISTATLLSLYEDFPEYMKTVKLNIPESNNKLPDVLYEVLWNLRWMLTMQDPNDGGVYHKLTTAKFDKMEMPDKDTAVRYVVQKSTAAALDLAAVSAQASRIFKGFDKELPGFADSCLKVSEYAYQWAVKNPNVLYEQDAMNKQFKPAVTTGTYGDRNVSDEFLWASAELYKATGKDEYFGKINMTKSEMVSVPTWSNVKLLGYYALADSKELDPDHRLILADIKDRLINFADIFVSGADSNAYQTVMTKFKGNFNWGSNSNAANQGILLIKAYKLTRNKKYLDYALANLDYLLGRNGSGYCYVTGFGSKPTMHPHHRPSVADGVVDPIPGLLAGGPNPGMQDKIQVPSTAPDEAYIDDDRSYATNEIAINWNAPVAYLANAIEALQKELKP